MLASSFQGGWGVLRVSSWLGGGDGLANTNALGVRVLTEKGVGSSGEECNLAEPYSFP